MKESQKHHFPKINVTPTYQCSTFQSVPAQQVFVSRRPASIIRQLATCQRNVSNIKKVIIVGEKHTILHSENNPVMCKGSQMLSPHDTVQYHLHQKLHSQDGMNPYWNNQFLHRTPLDFSLIYIVLSTEWTSL